MNALKFHGSNFSSNRSGRNVSGSGHSFGFMCTAFMLIKTFVPVRTSTAAFERCANEYVSIGTRRVRDSDQEQDTGGLVHPPGH